MSIDPTMTLPDDVRRLLGLGGPAGAGGVGAPLVRPVGVSPRDLLPPKAAPAPLPRLSAEQQRLLDAVAVGRDVVVDATVGSGKTTAIQALCQFQTEQNPGRRVLYLTYSKLLKADAQRRVTGARVQNYHGIVYPSLRAAGIQCGISESIRVFNQRFAELAGSFPRFDLLVVDEYQDINEEYAQLLRNIKSLNPAMQVVLVGDMEQKVRSDTVLDVAAFVKEFTNAAEHVPFTQSFRIGPGLGNLLGRAWNKPVVGVNVDQQVHHLSFEEAKRLIGAHQPGQILCLGKRNGAMAEMLNRIESSWPEVYNKNTVYASIRETDAGVSYGEDAAVFTTFDASKGLERPISIVFDYDEVMWDMRLKFPNADPEVLRNVFLVAASRGKSHVVFVKGQKQRAVRDGIGFIPVHRFRDLPEAAMPVYDKPFWVSEAFSFKYAENVVACFDLLERERLDDGRSPVIEVERSEGLIDLSPAVAHYQEALFFTGYSAAGEVSSNPSPIAESMASELSDNAWRNALVLTAVDTEQYRYVDQVSGQVPAAVERAIVDRLGTVLPRNAPVQAPLSISGVVRSSAGHRADLMLKGVADAVHDGELYELRFASELDQPMFLQLGMYLVMAGVESGVLWNVRTDERWRVRVPDRQAFLDAVAKCVTKQTYDTFESNRVL